MPDNVMAVYDEATDSVIIRLESGREIAVFDRSEAESFGSEVLAASRGESTGYESFLAQERGHGICRECGEEMFLDDNEVAHHYSEDGPDHVDHDADADHVAVDENGGL